MDIEVRTLPGPVDPRFTRAWDDRIARAPHANFTLRRDYLLDEAARGAPARLVLVEDGRLRGALVLRESGRELVCGSPWRVQAVVEDADPTLAVSLTATDAARLFEAAQRVAGRHRLRFYSPHPAAGAGGSHLAGHTMMLDLAHHTEEELYAGMHHSKRGCVRRACRHGIVLCDTPGPDLERAFAALLDDVHTRRHGHCPDPPSPVAAPGEDWRTWERPWHALSVALRDGEVVAGIGWGQAPGGTVESRTSAATEGGRHDGASVLLVWETARRAREQGHTWLSLCGANRFKREFGGVVIPLHARLGGGVEWLAPNLVENLVRGEARRAARVVLSRLTRLRAPAAGGREVAARIESRVNGRPAPPPRTSGAAAGAKASS